MKAKQKKLTIKQRKFVEAVVETGNRAQAARIA
jgi:phage terminase small subunit